MKKIFCVLLVGILAASASNKASADIVFSTSGTDASGGSSLRLTEGEVGSIFVWVSSRADQTFTGISLDILSSNASILQATAHVIANPSARWVNTDGGVLGDLVDDSFGLALPGIAGTGLNTTGLTDFVLFSEVQFDATAVGDTNLSFAVGSQGIGDNLGSVAPGTIAFGTGSVRVVAVPEPSSYAVLGVLGLAIGGYRRLRRLS